MLVDQTPTQTEGEESSAQPTHERNSSKTMRDAASATTGVKKKAGRPKKTEEEKKAHKSGSAKRKKRKETSIEVPEETRESVAPAQNITAGVPADDVTIRCLYGIFKQMKATVASEQHEWMREQALVVFEKGIRALSDEEVQNMSLEWLRKVPMPNYLNALQDRSSQLFGDMQRILSPADHINLVLLLLPDVMT